MSIRETVAMITAKYANMPPPDDYPLYGDTIDFIDEVNGRRYRGIVKAHNEMANTPFHNVWLVAVTCCLDEFKGNDKCILRKLLPDNGKNVLSVKKSEINVIYRQAKYD